VPFKKLLARHDATALNFASTGARAAAMSGPLPGGRQPRIRKT
jgi:hypothetical protein